MSDNITAESRMLRQFERIRSDKTLDEAMTALVHLQSDAERPNALVAVDADGKYEGVLTARLLFKSLFALWSPGKSVLADEARLERELHDLVADRAQLRVHDALVRGLPTVTPTARLLECVEAICEQRLEFLPVVEGGHPLGLVPVTAVFEAVSALALRPEDQGIQFE